MDDYTQLTNEQLSELIYRLSAESRNRYATEQALLACGVERAKPAETTVQLDKIRKLTITETVDYENRVVNIDAKASVSSQEAIPYDD